MQPLSTPGGFLCPQTRSSLPSSSLSTLTSTPVAPRHPAEKQLPVHTQHHDSEPQDIPFVCPASHTGVQAATCGLLPHVSDPEQCQDFSLLRSAQVLLTWGLPAPSSGAEKRSQVAWTLTTQNLLFSHRYQSFKWLTHIQLISPLTHLLPRWTVGPDCLFQP